MTPGDQELNRGLGRVEGKLDQVLASQTRHFEEDALNFASIALRFATLEKMIWMAVGAVSVLSPLAVYGLPHLLPAIAKAF